MIDKIHVLWVDDDEEIGPSFISAASIQGFDVQQFLSWEVAERELSAHFFRWDAVILDAHCVIKEGDTPGDYFLATAVERLRAICTTKGAQIPWYILSAGPSRILSFESVVGMVKGQSGDRDPNWGEMVFLKLGDYQKLYATIAEAVRCNGTPIERLHRDLFAAMETLGISQAEQVRVALDRLHMVESHTQFRPQEYRGTLRITVEELFRRAHDIGMVPDDFFDEQSKFKDLSGTSRYLAGRGNVDNLDARCSEAFFPEWVANALQGLLSCDAEKVHSSADDQVQTNSLRSLFAYTLLLGDVLIWFADIYERQRNNPEVIAANKNRRQHIVPPQEVCDKYEGKFFDVQHTDGVAHIDQGLVLGRLAEGTRVKVTKVTFNTTAHQDLYPYFFKTTSPK